MDQIALTYFPFPYLRNGVRVNGLRYAWADRCASCDRQCEKVQDSKVHLCTYGVNYFKLDEDILVSGIVVQDFPTASTAQKKMLRASPKGPTQAEVESVRQVFVNYDASREAELRTRRDKIVADYLESEQYKEEALELHNPKLKEVFAQIHDYRQFVVQVVQNINVILEKRHPNVPTEEKLLKASHEEIAIYWAARLMEQKLESALYLLQPERIDDAKNRAKFRFHGCVSKYLKIYQRSFEQKRIHVEQVGTSFGEIVANGAAIGVIPHTFLDNALKYSPAGTRVQVKFSETSDQITLSVGSYGPRIGPNEFSKIFDLFYRGEDAVRDQAEGTGFGLHLAQRIAIKHGTKIVASQDQTNVTAKRFWTVFSITFPRET